MENANITVQVEDDCLVINSAENLKASVA
jgi:hypothetical protein